MPALGDTFRLDNRNIDDHLHIIISDPSANPDIIVTANFTSWRSDKDQSCIVESANTPKSQGARALTTGGNAA